MNKQTKRTPRSFQRMRVKRKVSVQTLISRALETRQERKVSSTQASGVGISSAGTVINLTNSIIEGNDINQRSGTTIRVTRQAFRMIFRAITNDQSARFIIFRDLFNTGTTPTVTEVLPTTGILSHFSDTREIQQRRYHILLDRMIDCSVAGPSILSDSAILNFKGNVYYNGSTAVASANGRGAIFLLVIGSLSTGTYDYDWQGTYSDA